MVTDICSNSRSTIRCPYLIGQFLAMQLWSRYRVMQIVLQYFLINIYIDVFITIILIIGIALSRLSVRI